MLSSASPGISGHHSRHASPRKAQSPLVSGSRGRPSRLRTPSLRRSSVGSAGNESHRVMDIDRTGLSERGKQAEEACTFALSDTLSVRLAATHPIEMQQEFSLAVPTRDVFNGSIHVLSPQSSYSVVTSKQTCFVWKNDLNSPFRPPTCYMFPAPPPSPLSPYLMAPHASLLPFGASREPGLILVSSSGEVRFWDSIGTGLAGAERFSTTSIGLAENETVEGIHRVDAAVYLVRTKVRLHRLTVTARPGTGKFTVTATPFVDPQEHQGSSWFNPLKILQRRNACWEGGVVAVVSPSTQENMDGKSKEHILRGREARSVWVLTRKNLMKWRVNLEDGEQCEVNYNVKDVVAQAISDGVEGDKLSLDLELLDFVIDTAGNPMLLISYSPFNVQELSPTELSTVPARIYALVHLRLSPQSEMFVADGGVELLPYELAVDTRRASPPQLGLLEYSYRNGTDGDLKLAFSQFPDAFAFTSLLPPYQEQLLLKGADDMILGFNVLEHAHGKEILILTSGMVLAARPHFGNISKMRSDVHIGKANVLKSTIQQAMKYGIKPENPLRFQLPSIADGDSLRIAAEQMSNAFLSSDPNVVPETLSMGAQLSSRQNALQALVTFIGESGALGKLSQSTREQLLRDAEKLAAVRGLWDCYNEQTQKFGSPSLLLAAIEAYTSRVNFPHKGDAIRAFSNFQVQHVGALVPEIVNIVKDTLSSSERPQTQANILLQANGLVQALFSQAFRYRSENRLKYQIQSTLVQPWTSEPNLLVSLRRLFDVTLQLRKAVERFPSDNAEASGGDSTQHELTLQLRELANCLFRVYKGRLDFLDSRSSEGSGSERERNKLNEEFCTMRPEVLGQLVRTDSADYAFQLAETYRDFHALSELSYHASANEAVPADKRIRGYIQMFREEFTSELYKWYIEQGKLKLMFDQEIEFGDDISHFFDRNPAPRISWIHDIAKQEYHHAASALLEVAEKETSREARHLMLSIGKLASMAEGPAATPQGKIKAFNNALDFMAIHDILLEQFNDEFGNPADFAVETRVQTITSARCAIPTDRPRLIELFRRILRDLLRGHALTEEDAVDLLSMKDNSGHPSDFVDALVIISNSTHMSESRKSTSLRNVWRRIYLHDDWAQIHDTANKNDHTLTVNLRITQLYKTLASPSLPRNGMVPPSEAAQAPTVEEIEARWPGMAPNQVSELCRDFTRECEVLSQSGPSDADFLHMRKVVEADARSNL